MLCLPYCACPLWHCCQEGRREKGGEEGRYTERGREGHAVARERGNRKRRSQKKKELRKKVRYKKKKTRKRERRVINCCGRGDTKQSDSSWELSEKLPVNHLTSKTHLSSCTVLILSRSHRQMARETRKPHHFCHIVPSHDISWQSIDQKSQKLLFNL